MHACLRISTEILEEFPPLQLQQQGELQLCVVSKVAQQSINLTAMENQHNAKQLYEICQSKEEKK